MNKTTRWLVIIGLVIVLGIILICVVGLILGNLFFRPRWDLSRIYFPIIEEYKTNGERIYFTGTSRTGPPIIAASPGMHGRMSGRRTCAGCHGEDGKGGRVTMMMTTAVAPDIRYMSLIEDEHDEDNGEDVHPPYTNETIKRAIRQGINPAGEPLNWIMPRWDMTDEQVDDLLDFLKTLE
jgi:cytochrome c oxidase subunit II